MKMQQFLHESPGLHKIHFFKKKRVLKINNVDGYIFRGL